jgi:outer membrane lipoprotein-sorting protein
MKAQPLIALLAVLAVPVLGSAQTAEEIIAQNIAARGGTAKFAAVHSLRVATVDHTNWGGTGSSVLQLMRLERIRVDYSWQANRKSELIRVIMSSDGKEGWWADAHKGLQTPNTMTVAQIEPLREGALGLWATSLGDLNAAGFKVELVGSETVDGKPCYKIRFTTQSGQERYAYYDAKSFLVIRYDVVVHGKKNDKTLTVDVSDYKSERGILFPHMFTAHAVLTSAFALAEGLPSPFAFFTVKKDSATSSVETIEINPGLEESSFQAPALGAPEHPKH